MNKTYAWRAYAVFSGVQGSLSDGVVVQNTVACAQQKMDRGRSRVAAAAVRRSLDAWQPRIPQKLVKTSTGDFSLERRKANMEFIRDRIIETGRCKGMDLGRNFKRGTPVISHDFIVLRSGSGKNGRDRGVDIASGYDAVQNHLKLTWQVFDADKNWGHPFYAAYGPVDCSGV